MSLRGGKIIQYGRRKEKRRADDVLENKSKRVRLHEKEGDNEEEELLRPERTSSPLPSRMEQLQATGSRHGTRTRSSSPTAQSKPSHPPVPKPKDLSDIFAPLSQPFSSPSPLTTPKKPITKQMLVRSRTESSLLSPTSSSPSTSRISASVSYPNLSTTPNESSHKRQKSPPITSISASPAPFRTYSQERTFLPPQDKDSAPQDAQQDIMGETRESYTDLRARWGVDRSEDDPAHVPVLNDLLSITELRSKGESRRFLDQVGYLFEGLQDSGLSASVRRSSAAEVVLKMCDADFSRRAKATDFVSRTWDALRKAGAGDGDKLLDQYLLFFVALVSRDRRDIDDLSRKGDFYNTMIDLMSQTEVANNISDLGYSKSENATFNCVRNAFVSKSSLLVVGSMPTTRNLVSSAVSRASASTYPPQIISAVMSSLAEVCLAISPAINGIALSAICLTTDLEHLQQCLHILDAFLLRSNRPTDTGDILVTRRETLCSNLISLCIMPRILPEGTIEYDTACQCRETALRILITLSDIHFDWASILATSPCLLSFLVRQMRSTVIQKVKDEAPNTSIQENSINCRSLSLALLSNLVLTVASSKAYMGTLLINQRCPFEASCLSSCHCSKRVNAVEYISNVFGEDFQCKIESTDVEEREFFRCHLAALLCLLTVDSPENERTVRACLARHDTVEKFSNSVQSFLEFYQVAQGRAGEIIQGDSQGQIVAACARLRLNISETA